MPELSLNLEIKGLGTTNMSMDDAKKLYNELRVLFEEKVKYVYNYGWNWNYPWWGYSYFGNQTYGGRQYKSTMGDDNAFALSMMNQQASGSTEDSSAPESYYIKI